MSERLTIQQFVNRYKVRIANQWADTNPHMSDMPAGSAHWKSTLRCRRKQMTVYFSQGPAVCKEPEAVDVVNCLGMDAAGVENERNTLMITDGRINLVVTQIAGIVARRIVCWKKVGETVEKGQLIGLIRFGSRVDVFLPPEVPPAVAVGDRVRGGASILARLQP